MTDKQNRALAFLMKIGPTNKGESKWKIHIGAVEQDGYEMLKEMVAPKAEDLIQKFITAFSPKTFGMIGVPSDFARKMAATFAMTLCEEIVSNGTTWQVDFYRCVWKELQPISGNMDKQLPPTGYTIDVGAAANIKIGGVDYTPFDTAHNEYFGKQKTD